MEYLVAAISDTHVGDGLPDLPLCLLDLLDQREPNLFLYAGDLTEGWGVLRQLADIAETIAVKGDNDHIRLSLQSMIPVNGQTIALTHGDWTRGKEFLSISVNKVRARFGARRRWWNGFLDDMCLRFLDDQPDCIVCGHLHYPINEYRNQTLVVSPGAVYITGRGTQRGVSPSIAFLSIKPQTIQAEIVPLSLSADSSFDSASAAPSYPLGT